MRRLPVRLLPALLAPLLLATGCGQPTQPGPLEAPAPVSSVSRLLSPATLAAADHGDPAHAWTLVASASDYTPTPCGVPVRADASQTATWRNQATVAQVTRLRYPSPARAAEVVAALQRQTHVCRTWIEADVDVDMQPSQLPVPHAAVVAHLSRFAEDGRTEVAWAVGRPEGHGDVLSMVVSRPSATTDPGVDRLLRAAWMAAAAGNSPAPASD